MRRAVEIAGSLLAVGAIVYVAAVALPYLDDLPAELWTTGLVRALAAAIAAVTVTGILASLAWRRLMQDCGQPIGAATAVAIYCLSQAAKYLPGNIGHLVGRVALARWYGCRVAGAVQATAWELGLVLAGGLGIGLLMVAWWGWPEALSGSGLPSALIMAGGLVTVLIGALAAAALLLPNIVARLALRVPRPAAAASATLAYLGCFAGNGVALWLITGAVVPAGVSVAELPMLTGLFALAWVAGFVVPGAPAGLGVREAVLLGLLQPLFGMPAAVSVTLLIRLVTTAADLALFAVGALAFALKPPARLADEKALVE